MARIPTAFLNTANMRETEKANLTHRFKLGAMGVFDRRQNRREAESIKDSLRFFVVLNILDGINRELNSLRASSEAQDPGAGKMAAHHNGPAAGPLSLQPLAIMGLPAAGAANEFFEGPELDEVA